jgi:hypothetical protein
MKCEAGDLRPSPGGGGKTGSGKDGVLGGTGTGTTNLGLRLVASTVTSFLV